MAQARYNRLLQVVSLFTADSRVRCRGDRGDDSERSMSARSTAVHCNDRTTFSGVREKAFLTSSGIAENIAS